MPWHLLKLTSGNENMGVSGADNSVKIWRNLPISNPKPDLHNINAHTKFGEIPLMFTQVIIRKRNTDGRTTDGRTHGRPVWNHNTRPHIYSCFSMKMYIAGLVVCRVWDYTGVFWSHTNLSKQFRHRSDTRESDLIRICSICCYPTIF